MRVLLLALVCIGLANIVNAELQKCSLPLRAGVATISFDDESELALQVTLREHLVDGARYLLPTYWFEEHPWCDGAVAIDHLARLQRLDTTEGYCLDETEHGSWELIRGNANFRGRCAKTMCAYYRDSSEYLGAAIVSIQAYAASTRLWAWLSGFDVVKHASGELIKTKYGKYVAKTLGRYGTKSLHLVLKSNPYGWAWTSFDIAHEGADYLCRE
jgi:hypothetical protein